jgi:small subunit ribosomal protein S16
LSIAPRLLGWTADRGIQVGILEPKYRVGQVQGQVIKADSAAKSLIPEAKPAASTEATS